jgi:hypothetical protein
MLARVQAQSSPDAALEWAGRSITSRPDNPDAYLAQALGYVARKDYPASYTSFAQAAQLRPRDYFIWQEWAGVCDLAGDTEGALQNYQKALQLAPYYAETAWQLGHLLLRKGDETEALVRLRQAALRHSFLWPSLIDLTWQLKGQDMNQVESILKPEGDAALTAFARFCATHQRPVEALRFYRQVRAPTPVIQDGLISDLMAGKHYPEARELWLQGAGQPFAGDGPIINSGFEHPLNSTENGFGWRYLRAPGISVSQDGSTFQAGTQALRLDYAGEVNNEVLTQLIVVRPNTNYTLSVAAKSRAITTGGLPVIT